MMVHMVRVISISTCLLWTVAMSVGTPLPKRTSRCEKLCESCKDETILAHASCNCTTNLQRAVQDSPCSGKLESSPNEKSPTRQKRCTAEELYQLRQKIEATKRNIERLRYQKSLYSANPLPVYYPRQAPAVPRGVHPLLTPLAPAINVLRPPLVNLENVWNPQALQADRESALRSPLVRVVSSGNPRSWQIGSLDELRHSQGNSDGTGHPRSWQRFSEDIQESPRAWRRKVDDGQDPQDINDSVAPRRHVERAPMSVPETTTTDPIEFLQNRRQLLEENLQILLNNVNNISAENGSDVSLKMNNESKQFVNLTEDLNEHLRKIEIVTSSNENNTTRPSTKLSQIPAIAQFHKRNDIVRSPSYVNRTLSQQNDDLSRTQITNQSNQLKNVEIHSEQANVTRLQVSGVSNYSHIEEQTVETSTTTTSEPVIGRDNNSTRKRLEVIVDIAVMPNSNGNKDSRVAEQVDSLESEEERRKEAFVSQHTPQTLSPPIVLDSNPGFRMSRNQEDESDEVLNQKEFVPSVSKVFILKSFKSENANFGIPKAQDLFLHKKDPSVLST